jgi:hypothetical protein
MTNQNFTSTFSRDQAPEEVFRAINHVRGWWSEEIEGTTDKLGAEFTYHYKDVRRCKMKITEFVPGQKIVWLVLDNDFNRCAFPLGFVFSEIFEVSKKNGRAQLRFTHQGFVPEHECFNVCSNAWGSQINGSLQSLIETGKGRPNQKENGEQKKGSR